MSVDLCDTAVRCDPEPGIVAGIVAGRPHPLSTPLPERNPWGRVVSGLGCLRGLISRCGLAVQPAGTRATVTE